MNSQKIKLQEYWHYVFFVKMAHKLCYLKVKNRNQLLRGGPDRLLIHLNIDM